MFLVLVMCLVGYGLATAYLTFGVTQQKPLHKGVTLGFVSAGLVAHVALIFPKIFTDAGLNFNLYNVLSLTTLFMLLFYALFSLYRPILILGILATPLAITGALLGYFGIAPYQALKSVSVTLQAHIITSLAAYCVLFMAAVQAVMLRLQIRELKKPSIHKVWVTKLPALQNMESLLFDMIIVGFVLLTVSLGLGFVDVTNLLAQHLVHKTVFSVLSWLVFGTLLIGHWRAGWRGIRAAHMTLYGVILLALAFIGTKFVLELVLGR